MKTSWAPKFSRFMGWRIASNIDRIDSRDAVVVLRDGATLTREDFSTEALDDLLRSAIMLGVSGLDRYVHERVVKNIVKSLRAGNLNRSQEEFSIPAHLALDVTRALQDASKRGEGLRPANEIRNKVQEIIHLRPFQSWREIEYAFELIGISNLSGQLQTAYAVGDIRPKKRELNEIVRRRNNIVHEGDLIRHKRGGKTKCNSLSPKFVRDGLTFLDDLCEKLDAIS